MALISCPECNKQVSEKAPQCPHCGSPIATKGKKNDKEEPMSGVANWFAGGVAKLVGYFCIAIIIAGVVSGFRSCTDRGPRLTQEEEHRLGEEAVRKQAEQ
jgi:DNA-directed RNA polymerase subunit RPC12/RpoP